MPLGIHDDLVVGLELFEDTTRLPVPGPHVAVRVAAAHEPTVRTEAGLAGVAGDQMACKALLAVHAEAVARAVHDDLVIEGLAREPLLVGVECDGRHRVHVRLGNVLDHDRDIKLPGTHRLVVRGRHEPAVVVHECDGVDRAQMLVVLLRDIAGLRIVLDDLLVGAADQKGALLARFRVERHAVRDLAEVEGPDALARLGVPQLDKAVVTRTQKLAAVVIEGQVAHGLAVAMDGAQQTAVVVYVPDLQK